MVDLRRHKRDSDSARATAMATTPSVPAAEQERAAPAPVAASRRRPLMWSLGALLLAIVSGIAVWTLKPSLSPDTSSAPRSVSTFAITLPPGDRLVNTALALSPDGTRVAYVATRGGTPQLYLRAMDQLQPKPIPGTEGASFPFFSPDGQWLGFLLPVN